MSILALTTQVLRDPDALAERADRTTLAALAPPLLALALGGAALLGVAAGSSHGPLQSAFAAVKLPVLFLAPPLVVLPLVHAFAEVCEVPVGWARLGLSALAGLARSGLLAAAAAPLLWLPLSLDTDYHFAILLFVGTFMTVLMPAVSTVSRAIPRGGMLRWMAMPALSLALGLVIAQTGWVLRPFVSRPKAEVTFLRPVEADVFSAIGATTRSATGDYRDDWKPASSGVMRGRR